MILVDCCWFVVHEVFVWGTCYLPWLYDLFYLKVVDWILNIDVECILCCCVWIINLPRIPHAGVVLLFMSWCCLLDAYFWLSSGWWKWMLLCHQPCCKLMMNTWAAMLINLNLSSDFPCCLSFGIWMFVLKLDNEHALLLNHEHCPGNPCETLMPCYCYCLAVTWTYHAQNSLDYVGFCC